ncbi:GlcA/glcB antiterminator [Dirofilaria immitis]
MQYNHIETLILQLPYFLRHFTYLICRSLKNLIQQSVGSPNTGLIKILCYYILQSSSQIRLLKLVAFYEQLEYHSFLLIYAILFFTHFFRLQYAVMQIMMKITSVIY